jgi:hypothetical protein
MKKRKRTMNKVFVLNRHGHPLMPTTPRQARLLLQSAKAKIVRYAPFVIQLLFGSSGYKQKITLGIDSGYTHIGFSALTEREEVFAGELRLLEGISERISERRMYRTQRRQHLRYRKPRFENRRRQEEWLPPSIHHKLTSHSRLIGMLKNLLPITKVTIEVANFDIQKIKDPTIEGKDYQKGEQTGFWNLREYILHRDSHECQNPDCKNKSKQKILEIHHLGFWNGDRSDRPSNLITLCIKCHTPKNHQEKGFLHGWEPNINSFKAETFMSIVRWRLVNMLDCKHTYGYLTKMKRRELALPKSHINDAFVIANGTTQIRANPINLEQIRRNNRALQKFYDAKYLDTRTGEKASGQELFSGRRTRNKNLNEENLRQYRGHKTNKGRVSIRRQRYKYQPKDLVQFQGKKYQVKGMQNYGLYIKLDGLAKPVKTELVTPFCWRKGICRAIKPKAANSSQPRKR